MPPERQLWETCAGVHRNRAFRTTVEPEDKDPDQEERPADIQVVDQIPKRWSTRLFVRDPAEPCAIIRMLARIVVDDRPETRAELVEQECIDLISRGDSWDNEKREGRLPESQKVIR